MRHLCGRGDADRGACERAGRRGEGEQEAGRAAPAGRAVSLMARWAVVVLLELLGAVYGGVLVAQTRGGVAGGEQVTLAERGPRFYWWAPDGGGASGRAGRPVRVEARGVAVLRARIGVALEDATLPAALSAIGAQAGLRLVYDPSILPRDARVSLRAEDITVAAALTHVLLDANVDVELGPGSIATLTARRGSAAARPPATGSVAGHVTDVRTGRPVPYATVQLVGTGRGASATDSGTYRIANVPPGAYTLEARALGYTPARQPVTVSADQVTVSDIAIERSASQMDQVVVTGTVAPTAVRAVSTPITVVTASEIRDEHPRTIDQIFREAVPSGVAWDPTSNPESTPITVRGASTLNAASGSVKIYLDGVEVSDRSFAAIDPNSIDHIEVVRGPQAGTLYGSDAIGGVMQVFTKRGDPGLKVPLIEASAAAGTAQSPYRGYSGAMREEFSASVRGGTPDIGYNLGAGYQHTDAWVLEGQAAIPSLYGGMRFTQGPLSIDLTARYYSQQTPQAGDPRLAATGDPYYSKPFYVQQTSTEETYGAHIVYAASDRWRHTVTIGVDRFSDDGRQLQRRFTTPADTELFVVGEQEPKASLGYNTSFTMPLSRSIGSTVTAGVDHYTLTTTDFFTTGALASAGTIPFDPAVPPSIARNVTQNTGYFGQLQLAVGGALFLTGGLRAEQNSNFGRALGTPLSPRFGVAYVRTFGATTLKTRGSYGEAIHPPDPSEKDAIAFATNLQLANPRLGPERQRGWDAGVDIAVGSRATFGATYYDQVAADLISTVPVSAQNQNYQFQNVGRVHNTGIELEGSYSAGPVILRGQYAYTRSRVNSVGANYTGDLRVGDQAWLVPHSTAGASATVNVLRRTNVTLGLSAVSSWTYYDLFTEFKCFAGSAVGSSACPTTTRGFLVRYPGFAKVRLGVDQEITSRLSAFVAVDNLTDNQNYELINTSPVLGRITMLGIRVRAR